MPHWDLSGVRARLTAAWQSLRPSAKHARAGHEKGGSRISFRLDLARVLTFSGLALLIAAGAQYGYMGYQQRALQQRFERQQQQARQARLSGQAVADDQGANAIMRLVMPTIDLKDIIVPGTDYTSLLAGPGWMRSTPLPGRVGNSVVAGHRDTFFRHVVELHPGDPIQVQRDGKTFTFRVAWKKIVTPDRTDLLGPDPAVQSTPELTLVTCYPTYWVGPAPKRLIIRAVETPAAQPVKTSTSSSSNRAPQYPRQAS